MPDRRAHADQRRTTNQPFTLSQSTWYGRSCAYVYSGSRFRVTWRRPSGRRIVPKTPVRPAILRGTEAAERTISGGHARAHAPVQWTRKSRWLRSQAHGETAPLLSLWLSDAFRPSAAAMSSPALGGLRWVTAPSANTLAFAIRGPIARADLPGLCDRVCALLRRSSASVAVCDVRGVGVDAVTVDALARLQLAARRHRCEVRLRNAPPELLELVAFMGLTDVLPE